MTQKHKIQLFEDKKVRTTWDDEKGEWYFSIVDVCGVLTEQKTQRGASNYWAVLKNRLIAEGAGELITNCKQLKMRATDGKMRSTDAADTEQMFRIIQSIPSKKAELRIICHLQRRCKHCLKGMIAKIDKIIPTSEGLCPQKS